MRATFVTTVLLLILFASQARAESLRERWLKRREGREASSSRFDSSAPLKKIESGGRERTFRVHLPAGHDPKKAYPLVLLFHGGGGGAEQALNHYPLQGVADREGFILVAPNGIGRFEKEVLRTWNVQFGFGLALREKVDDVAFVDDLLDHLIATYRIDEDRVYLTGLSNGAILCHFVAAALGERIAAIAPVVGTAGGRKSDQATMQKPPPPVKPVAVLLFNGEKDDHIPLEGGLQRKSAQEAAFIMSADETARFWVEADGCRPEPEVEKNSQKQYRRYSWTGGKNGTEVTLYVLEDQGHAWPGGGTPRSGSDAPTKNVAAHEVMWEFFEAHPRRRQR